MPETDDLSRLLAQAEELREEASELLVGEGLLKMIQLTGPTRVVGSYTLDLMTSRDIDFSVQLPHERDVRAFFELGRRIVDRFQVTRMHLQNVFLRPWPLRDHGLYWGVQLLHADRTWKLDIWGFGDEAYAVHAREAEELAERLAGADRETILRLKDALSQRPEYGVKLSSWDVYEAVTLHGVRTVEEFDAWWSGRSN